MVKLKDSLPLVSVPLALILIFLILFTLLCGLYANETPICGPEGRVGCSLLCPPLKIKSLLT